MVTNADRIKTLRAQLDNVKKDRDHLRARLNKHIEAARKRREKMKKKKNHVRVTDSSDDDDGGSSDDMVTRAHAWKHNIKNYWTGNEVGEDARDEIQDLYEESKKLISLLREIKMPALAGSVRDIFDSYSPDYCDMHDNFVFYDETKKILLLAKEEGQFK